MRRIRLGFAAAAVAVLAVPATASAHGLVQRSNLPIPEWLFGWAAALVLVLSFVALAVLWPRPRLQADVAWRPLPWGIGRTLGSRPVEVLCGAIGVGLFVVVILAGYLGSGTALDNFAPTFILITFWVGLVFLSVLFGDVFRAFSPWRAIGRLLPRSEGLRPYPAKLGRWPAALALLVFTWIELASGWGERPGLLVSAALGYALLTLAAQVVWGVETWSRYGEAFSVYFNLFSRMSAVETRDRVVGLRPPLSGLPRLDPKPGTVGLLSVMIGTVTFDGLTQGQLWKDVSVDMTDVVTDMGFSINSAPQIVDSIGLVVCVLLVAGFYRAGIAGARSIGGDLDTVQLRRAFVHSLVPIAMVYVAAHYLTFLLFEGQAIRYLASDPFSQGWDLFGTASAAIDYSLLSQNGAWYLQVGFVVAGHVAALILAHDRALALYSDAKLAVRSQYWMLAIMVGFTTLALWLLAQAGS
jgi:hypothetical protein